MARTMLRPLVVMLTGLLVALGLQVVAATPAAAIPGLQNVMVTTVADSSTFKQVIANCPAGKRVIGGGGRLSLATGEVAITYLAPMTTATAYEARAYEDFDGFAGVWSLTVYAICAFTPAGYEIRTAASPMASPATASATATCTAGRVVLGTGGTVFPGRGVVLMTGIVPSPVVGPTSVTTLGAEVPPGFAGTWNVQSWAICASPVPGHSVSVTTGVIDSTSPKTQVANCPGGTFVHGVGFQFGGVGVGEIFLNLVFPNPMPVGTGVPVVASEDQTGVAGNWGIRTYAVCAA
ncbi:MAG TPA: hypothetical protein VGD67_22690 [Pseudonocardiaceae bacterium]